MTAAHILVVEDEAHIARGLVFNLQQEGHRVTHVTTGEAALEMAAREVPALVVLDLMLPGMHGLEVCRRLRESDPHLPILMLTALGETGDRVRGLEMGADDYLTKPFHLREFLLRVNALLRRSHWARAGGSPSGTVSFGDNQVDLTSGEGLTVHGPVTLTELERKMLRVFVQNPDRVLSRGELLQSVWGMDPAAETRTVDNFIVRLRRYFERDPAAPLHFETVRGRGYRFRAD